MYHCAVFACSILTQFLKQSSKQHRSRLTGNVIVIFMLFLKIMITIMVSCSQFNGQHINHYQATIEAQDFAFDLHHFPANQFTLFRINLVLAFFKYIPVLLLLKTCSRVALLRIIKHFPPFFSFFPDMHIRHYCQHFEHNGSDQKGYGQGTH